jgi:hypothetical protein
MYQNPGGRDTFGKKPLHPKRYTLRTASGEESIVEGSFLPDAPARDLRAGKFDRVVIELG